MSIIEHQSFDAERSKSCPRLEEDLSLEFENPSTFMLYPHLTKSESLDNLILFSHDSKTGSWKCNLVPSPPGHSTHNPLKLKDKKLSTVNVKNGSSYSDIQLSHQDEHSHLKPFSDVAIFPQQPSETLSSSTVSKFFPRFFNKNDQVICELLFSTETVDVGIILHPSDS